MENKTPRYPKKVKREKTWNLLLVGDHGRVINFGKIKGAVISLSVISFVAVMCSILLFYLYVQKKNENNQLLKTKTGLQESISDLKEEKDILMAQLVVAQAKLEKNAPVRKVEKKPDVAGQQVKKDKNKKTASAKTTLAKTLQNAKARDAVVKKPVKQKPVKPEKKEPVQLSVNITKFSVFHNTDTKLLMARFKINNTTKGNVAVAGRSVVVFTRKDDAAKKPLTLPLVSLRSGRPNGKKGQSFKIRRFKLVALKSYNKPNPLAFDQATVYIFDARANLLFEKTYPVTFTYKKPKPVVSPAETETVSEKKETANPVDKKQKTTDQTEKTRPENTTLQENTGILQVVEKPETKTSGNTTSAVETKADQEKQAKTVAPDGAGLNQPVSADAIKKAPQETQLPPQE